MSSVYNKRGAPLLIALGLTEQEMEGVLHDMREAEGEFMVLEAILDGRKERAEKLAKEQGISLQTAYKKLQDEKFAEPVKEGTSKRDGILEALYRLNSNSGVSTEVLHSALKNMQIPMGISDLLGRLWDLQKQGFVKFNEAHTSHGSELRRIRLTPPGRAEAIRLRGGTPRQHEERVNARSLTVKGFSQSPRIGDHKPVGVDGTDFRNHRKVAKGGPIERIPPKEVRSEPEVVGPVEYPPVIPDPPRQNEKPAPAKPVKLYQAPPEIYVMDLKDYPFIAELVSQRTEREFRRSKAARIVEAASIMAEVDGNEAERLLNMAAEMEGISFTDLERDVLRLVDRLTEHAGDVKE